MLVEIPERNKRREHNRGSISNVRFYTTPARMPGQRRYKGYHHGIKVVFLTEKDRQALRNAASQVPGNPYSNLAAFRKAASDALDKILGSDLVNDFCDMGQHRGRNVAILIKNMPIASKELSDTPSSNTDEPSKKDFVSEAVLTAVADKIGGKIISEGDEGTAEKANASQAKETKTKAKETKDTDLKAMQNHEIEQIVPNSAINAVPTKFDIPKFMHVEGAHETELPDTLLLITLRGDRNAKSAVVSADKIANEIAEDVVKTLRKPEFEVYPEEGEGGEKMITSILGVNEHGQNTIRFHSDPKYTRGITPEAQDALTVLRAYLSNHRNVPRVALETGDVLVSDNKRALHGTYCFENSTPNPKRQRWLQRAYLKNEKK
ncbi:MAG: TauD/TfdA family dioxygenase [Pseudomonadota bacterium]